MHLWEIHPALVHFPIAFFIAGACLDLYGTSQGRADLARIGQGSLFLGIVTGLIAGFFGVAAFLTVPEIEPGYRSYLGWHFALNTLALGAFAIPVITRWGGRWIAANRFALIAEVVGILLLLVGGTLGHALVVKGGAGVEPSILNSRVVPRTPGPAHP